MREDILSAMMAGGMDAARLNFAWRKDHEAKEQVDLVRKVAEKLGRNIIIVADMPGPRIQVGAAHTYDASKAYSLTEKDIENVRFCVEEGITHIALSFVGSGEDVTHSRGIIRDLGGTQKIIAKIERKVAVENIDGIIAATDAVMVARGDLGSEVPLPEIPFIQARIIEKANAAGKPVIVATQMLASMVEHPEPTRAEVTDVTEAILQGADVVMLSEETAAGKYSAEAVAMMEQIIRAAENHAGKKTHTNSL